MYYSVGEVMEYVKEADVKFVRLAFCDISGRQKNVSVMPSELDRAFACGVSFDASSVRGFGDEVSSDLFLCPDPSTLEVLPWRPDHGRVVRMFCDIKRPDGSNFELDTRSILKKAVAYGRERGLSFNIGAEFEFYLFKTDDKGDPTTEPHDRAGYMDIAPDDRGENVRREVCLTLERMDIIPERSHHEAGPGQHEIDFRYSDPLSAADNAVTFKSVVRTVAARNGLHAEFSPKPITGEAGSGMHVNVSVHAEDGKDYTGAFMAGIIDHIAEMTAFLNPTDESYQRLGEKKAPKYISWSGENRSQLIRIPAVNDDRYRRIELRSPDPSANPYIAFALMLYAGIDGIERGAEPPAPADFNIFAAPRAVLEKFDTLPATAAQAKAAARSSAFIGKCLPEGIVKSLSLM